MDPQVYSKKITVSDANDKLYVSSERLKDNFFELPDGQLSLEVRAVDADNEDQSWTFVLKIRPDGYKKPDISGDWLRFVKDKTVQVDGYVEFLKEYYYDQAAGAEMIRYRMKVWAPVRVFGVLLG